MKARFVYLLALLAFACGLAAPCASAQGSSTLEVPVECLSRTDANHALILIRDGGNLEAGTVLRAYDPRGKCVATSTVPESGNASLSLWGEDSFAPAGGLRAGEPFRVVAVIDAIERPLTYALASGPSTYVPNGITTVTSPTVSAPGRIEVGFRLAEGTVRGSFERQIDVSGPFGAILLEVRGEGTQLTSITLTPDSSGALDTFVSDTLLAAALAMPGSDAYVVSVGAVPTAEVGWLEVTGVQAVDTSGNVIEVTVTQGLSQYTFLILGDVSGDGSVDLADLRAVFHDLLGIDRLSEAERVRADASPYPEGNGSITLQDFFALAKGLVRGGWPDGTDVQTSGGL